MPWQLSTLVMFNKAFVQWPLHSCEICIHLPWQFHHLRSTCNSGSSCKNNQSSNFALAEAGQDHFHQWDCDCKQLLLRTLWLHGELVVHFLSDMRVWYFPLEAIYPVYRVYITQGVFSYASNSTIYPCDWVSEWAEFPTGVALRLASLF